MEARSGSANEWTRLLRRARVVVEHHRYHGQPIDARAIVRRLLAGGASAPNPVAAYRALLEEAVESLVRGFR